jgi:hypothetical protein
MGGDQVYPDATRENYRERFRDVYETALLDRNLAIPLFLIPGNHDWYDGLDLFDALFCKKEGLPIGGWHVRQRRSYFAIQISDDWWLWGADLQLSEFVDRPQSEYFEKVANSMKAGSKIILCAAVPGWLYEEGKARSFESIGHIAGIARKLTDKNLTVPWVLSGDIHHYSRYIGNPSGTQFITSGGGGAFLHPTHSLAFGPI